MEKSYHHTDLKSELIREGLRILDTEGYEGLSLRKVAKSCDVSQTAPYRHFKNKDELIGAITLQAMMAFNSSLQTAVDRHPEDSKKQLKEMGVAYIRFFRDNPEYLRLLFLSNIRDKVDRTLLEEWDQKYCDTHREDHPFQTLNRAITRYKNDYPEEKMTQEELVLLCWGLVHGIATLMTTGELDHAERSMEIAEKMLRGENFLG